MSLIHHENLNLPYIIQKFSESISRIDPNNFSILKPEKKQDIRRIFERIKDKIIIENSKTDKAVVSILPHYIKELKKNKGFSLILDFIEDSRKNELNVDLSKYIKNTRILSMMQRLYEQVNRLYDNPRSKHIRGGAMTDIFDSSDTTHYNYYTIIVPGFTSTTTEQQIYIYFQISKESIKKIISDKEKRANAIKNNIKTFYIFVNLLLFDNLITERDFENLNLNNLLNDINAMTGVEQLNSDAELPTIPETIPETPGESVVDKLNSVKGKLMRNIRQILPQNDGEIELDGSIYFFNINNDKKFLNAYGPLNAVLKYNYNTRQVIDLKTLEVDCSNVIANMANNSFNAVNFFKGLADNNLMSVYDIDLMAVYGNEVDIRVETNIIDSFQSFSNDPINFVIVDEDKLFMYEGNKIHDSLKNYENFKLFYPNKKGHWKEIWYLNFPSKSLSYIGGILKEDAKEKSLISVLKSSIKEETINASEENILILNDKKNITAKARIQLNKTRGVMAYCVFLFTIVILVIYWFITIATVLEQAAIIAAGVIIIFIANICKEALSPIFLWIITYLVGCYDWLRKWGWLKNLPRFGDNFTDLDNVDAEIDRTKVKLLEGKISKKKFLEIKSSTHFDVLKKTLAGGSLRFTRKSKNKLKKTKKAIFNKQNKTIKKNKITGGMNNNKYLLNEIIYACVSILELIFFPEDHNMVTLNDYLTMTMSIIGNIKCFESDVTHHKKGKSIRASR
jgi:hypothetical protein